MTEERQSNILIVDDNPDNLRLLIGILKDMNFAVRPAKDGRTALSLALSNPPHLILMDIMMQDMNGYEVCRRLKADEKTKDIPVIFLSSLKEVFDKVNAFKAGGVDYISKPFQVEEVLVRVNTHLMIRAQQKALALKNRELNEKNKELNEKNALIAEQARKLERLATKDFLTGLSNRRDFQEKAQMEEKRFQRNKRNFAFVLLDIDHFKQVNDTYGHACGDKVLIGVACELEKALRAQDIVARWGGEEFICLLSETGISGAKHAAEKLRARIETHRQYFGDIHVSVTVTLGVCEFDGSFSIEECIRRADAALYQGKKRGRNQVVVA